MAGVWKEVIRYDCAHGYPQQLEFAIFQGRVIVSFNIADYEALAEQYFLEGREHWSFREMLHRLLQLSK